MKLNTRILAVLALFVCLEVPAYATTYHVDKTNALASNTNLGTSSLMPWATIGKAAANVVAGDTVIVAGGGIYDERVIPLASGMPGLPITFVAGPGPKPVVRGFTVSNRTAVIISGFEVTNTGMSADPNNAGIVATGSTGVQILSNTIHDTVAQAIRCNPNGTTAKCNGLIVRGNTMTAIGPKWDGVVGNPGRAPIIELWGDNSLIEGNDLSHGEDFLRVFGNNNVFRSNLLHDSVEAETAGGTQHIDGFQSYCSLNVVPQAVNYLLVEGNVHRDNPGVNSHFGLINGTDACGGSSTVIVRYNVIQNAGSASYQADTNNGLADNHKYYNNTSIRVSPRAHQTAILNGVTHGSVLNNIFVDPVMPSAPAMVYVLDGSGTSWAGSNLAFMAADPAQVWASPINSEPGVILNRDPLLASDLRLGAGSPAIGTGQALTVVSAADTGGTTLALEDAHFFQPGWAGVSPDAIAVGTPVNFASIVSIDYSANTVVLAAAIVRKPGDRVWLYSHSSAVVLFGAQDRGAYPAGVVIPVPPPIPPPPPPPPPTPPPNLPPVPGNSGTITTSSVTDSSVMLSWVKATDDTTAQSSLQYEVRRSTDNSSWTVIKAYSTNLTSLNAVSLRANTLYYFSVTVRDAAGNKAAYMVKSVKTLKRNGRP